MNTRVHEMLGILVYGPSMRSAMDIAEGLQAMREAMATLEARYVTALQTGERAERLPDPPQRGTKTPPPAQPARPPRKRGRPAGQASGQTAAKGGNGHAADDVGPPLPLVVGDPVGVQPGEG